MDYSTDVKEVSPITVRVANGIDLNVSNQGVLRLKLGGTLPILCRVYFIECINLNLVFFSCLEGHRVTKMFASWSYKLSDRYDRNDVFGVLPHMSVDGRFAGKIMVPLHKQR